MDWRSNLVSEFRFSFLAKSLRRCVAWSCLALPLPLSTFALDDPAVTPGASAPSPQETQAPELSTDEVERLIGELGADDFDSRERATDTLWRAGEQVVPALQRASSHPDREVSFRAKRILEWFDLGIFADTPVEKVRLIRRYFQADPLRRQQQVRQLVIEGNLDDVTLLLDRESNPEVKAQGEALVMGQLELLISPMMRSGDFERAIPLLERYSLNDFTQFIHVQALSGMGTDALRALIEKSDSLATESDPDRPARLRMFAYVKLGEMDRALEQADLLSDPSVAQGWRGSLLAIDGRWRELRDLALGSTEISENLESVDPAYLQVAAWAALASQDTETYERLRQVQQKVLLEQRNYLAAAMFEALVGDVDRAVEICEGFDRATASYLLAGQDRYVEAFEVSGIGVELEARRTWYETFLGELQQSDGTSPLGEPGIDPATKLKLAIEGAGWLLSVGEREEGSDYLDRILHSIPDTFPQRRAFEQRILALEFIHETNEQFAEHAVWIFGRPQFNTAFNEMRVSTTVPKAQYIAWWLALEQDERDVDKRYQLIRNLIGDSSDLRLEPGAVSRWVEIAYGFYQDENNRTSGQEWRQALAAACFRNGLQERGETILREGVELDRDLRSAHALIDHYRETKQWELVIELADQMTAIDEANRTRTRIFVVDPKAALEKANALAELGRTNESLQILATERRSRLTSSSLISLGLQFEELNMLEPAREVYRDCRMNPTGDPSQLFASNLVQAQQYLCFVRSDDPSPLKPSDILPMAPAMLSSGRPFYLIADPSTSTPQLFLLVFHETFHQANAWEAIEAGDWARVEAELSSAVRTRCGNVDNVLEFVDALEAAGQGGIVDRVFALNRDQLVAQVEKFPNSALHLNNLAWLCARANRDLELGRQSAIRATELMPFEHNYLDTLAEVEFRLGNVDRAIELAKQAVAMNPQYAHYREQLIRFEQAKAEGGGN